ncbi:hypothetical protein Droror1_Dr00002395 [Drosera rotundifolia]
MLSCQTLHLNPTYPQNQSHDHRSWFQVICFLSLHLTYITFSNSSHSSFDLFAKLCWVRLPLFSFFSLISSFGDNGDEESAVDATDAVIAKGVRERVRDRITAGLGCDGMRVRSG